jgi:predicted  nucleic acid-binding Zn-ribbon protein
MSITHRLKPSELKEIASFVAIAEEKHTDVILPSQYVRNLFATIVCLEEDIANLGDEIRQLKEKLSEKDEQIEEIERSANAYIADLEEMDRIND